MSYQWSRKDTAKVRPGSRVSYGSAQNCEVVAIVTREYTDGRKKEMALMIVPPGASQTTVDISDIDPSTVR